VDEAAGSRLWGSTAATLAAESVLVGACYTENAGDGHGASEGTEAGIAENPGVSWLAQVYRIEKTGGSYSVRGVWKNPGTHKNIAVAYLADTVVEYPRSVYNRIWP
jgi:hypothetical protein